MAGGERADTRRRAAQVVLLAAPVVAVVVMAWTKRFTTDDGFIDFRIVDQILAGHGPVFNVGERVEANTSVAWVALLALGKALFGWAGRLETIAVAEGLVLSGSAVVFAELAATELFVAGRWRGVDTTVVDGRHRPVLVPAGVLALVGFPPLWYWSTSGLDSALFMAWITGSAWLVARLVRHRVTADDGGGDGGGREDGGVGEDGGGGRRRTRRPRAWVTALVVGSGWLIRPDAAVFSVAFLAVVLLVADGWPRRWRLLAVGLAPSLAYEVFRAGYYASLLPNTALTKEGTGSAWHIGWQYLRTNAGTYRLAVVVPLLLAGAAVQLLPAFRARAVDRRRSTLVLAAGLAPVVGGVLHLLWVARVGGDYLEARFVLPGLVAVAVPAAVLPFPPLRASGAPATIRSWPTYATGAALAVVLGWTIANVARFDGFHPDAPGGDNRYTFLTRSANPTTTDDYPLLSRYGDAMRRRRDAGEDVLVDLTTGPPGQERVTVPTAPGTGVVGLYGSIGAGAAATPLDVWVVDKLGLADPIGSRLAPSPGLAGHSKRLPWGVVAGRFVAPDVALEPDGEAARRAMACGQLAELLAATTEPMTPGRFLKNLWQAPSFTTMRLPDDLRHLDTAYC